MSRPIRVLQVFNSLGMGGAETWLVEMLRHWHNSQNITCDVLLTSNEPGVLDEEVRSLGAKVHIVPFSRGRILRFALGFRQTLQKGHYDAIHDHQDRLSGWHFALGWPHLPPVRITHVHNPSYQIANNYEVNFSRRLTARIGKFFMRRFTTHITGTSLQVIKEYGFTAESYKHIPSAALHCAFDTTRFKGNQEIAHKSICEELGIRSNAKLILFAGRMDRSIDYNHPLNHKNSSLAVDILLKCVSENKSIHLLMAGATSDALPLLQKRVKERDCEKNFHFLGVRKDIEQLMLASHLLLFPSRGEGLGMVAVEAQAAGLRVLASTAVPSECVVVPELVTFMNLNQPVEEWAQKIKDLIALPKMDATTSNLAVSNSQFSVPVCSNTLIDLYAQGKLTNA